ncbi:MAG: DUF418 domain-containing protein [Bacteroidetes bacterium]|nr:DUF418 domain-containing protein [Bacteroidota bacterium]
MISKERIVSLDLLRGVAIAGILIMNIQSFSMPSAAYINPTAYGNLEGLNRWAWIVSHILARGKFMNIFSMLFGAGVLLFTQSAERKGLNCTVLHYRRMGWLLIFGLMHGYLLWMGDILVSYSLCGMLLFLFRNKRPALLIRFALAFFLVPIVVDGLLAWSMPFWPREAVLSTLESWRPVAETVQHHLDVYRGGWLEQMEVRIPATIFMQTGLFFMGSFWQVMALMLLGMALHKWNIFTSGRPRAYYIRMAFIGLSSGYLLSGAGVWINFLKGWTMEYSMFLGGQFNYVGSVSVALGYTGLIMLISDSGRMKRFINGFSAVGRTAFSNYILQTLVCTTIFYGHGWGLFGSVERKYLLLMVLGLWIVQLLLSTLWLRRFRLGPLEWLWRSLTYKKFSRL